MCIRLYTAILIIIITFFNGSCRCQITIRMSYQDIHWDGCLMYRKPLIQENPLDSCFNCSIANDQTKLIRRKGYPQRMYNCTDSCDQVTICTHARYNAPDSKSYPLCYHCFNKKNESIIFQDVRYSAICDKDCYACLRRIDLPLATNCISKCGGHPSFCYPPKKEFGQRMCYQAPFYGCIEKPVDRELRSKLSKECLVCVGQARNSKEGRECAFFCGGQPTWSTGTQGTDNSNGSSLAGQKMFHCQMWPQVKVTDVFLYQLPKRILQFFQISVRFNVYLYSDEDKTFDGQVKKAVMAPFNMTMLTQPRPKGFEDPL